MKHTEEYVFWPNALNGEFVRFFYDWLNAFQGSDEQTNELRDGVRQIIGGMPENVIDQLERTLIQAERIAGQAEPDSTLQKMAADIGGVREPGSRSTRRGQGELAEAEDGHTPEGS